MFVYSLLLLASVVAQSQIENAIPYCGSYESKCMYYKELSTKETAILSGKPLEEPAMVGLISNTYQEETCSDDMFLTNTAVIGSIQSENIIEGTYDVMIKDVFLVASEVFIEQLTCETPIKPMTQYKVQDVHCVDQTGEDPWATSKSIVGNILTYNVTFGADAIVIQRDEFFVFYKRISDDGCSMPTIPPTAVPPEPHLWMWLWIGSGIIMVVVVLIVIAQQCKKNNKDYVENKPLISV